MNTFCMLYVLYAVFLQYKEKFIKKIIRKRKQINSTALYQKNKSVCQWTHNSTSSCSRVNCIPIQCHWNVTYPNLEIHLPVLTFPFFSWHYCHLFYCPSEIFTFKKVSSIFNKSLNTAVIFFVLYFYSSLYSIQSVFTFLTTFVHYTYLRGRY